MGIIAGKNASVLENWLYSWINSGVQLVGYYAAALTVDVKFWGRRRMTVFSFFMVGRFARSGRLTCLSWQATLAGCFQQRVAVPQWHTGP